MNAPHAPQKKKFGETHLGGRDRSALAVAFAIAAPLTVALALAIGFWIADDTRTALVGAFASLFVGIPSFTALVWVVIVDRSTIRGTTRDPENSVEFSWLREAQSNAFLFTLCGIGISAGITSMLGYVTISTTLLIVAVAMMAITGLCYLVEKRK